MAIVIGDFYQFKIFSRLGNQLGLMIRQFEVQGITVGGASEQQLADAFSLSMSVSLKPCLANLASYFGVISQKHNGTTFVTVSNSKSGSGAGTAIAGIPAPAQTSGIISLQTGIPGRRNRGRAYVPFPSSLDSQAPAGVPQPTVVYVSNLTALSIKLQLVSVTTVGAPITTITLGGEIYHRATQTFTSILSGPVPPKWATQRRRGAYGAPNADPF